MYVCIWLYGYVCPTDLENRPNDFHETWNIKGSLCKKSIAQGLIPGITLHRI